MSGGVTAKEENCRLETTLQIVGDIASRGLLAVREVSRRRNCQPFVTDPPFWRVPTLAPENAKLICTPVVHHHHHRRRRRVFICVRKYIFLHRREWTAALQRVCDVVVPKDST